MGIKQNQPIKKHTNLYDWTLKAQPAPPHNCTKHGKILGTDLTTHPRNYPEPRSNLGTQHTKKAGAKFRKNLNELQHRIFTDFHRLAFEVS
jgi:hypothetical protein